MMSRLMLAAFCAALLCACGRGGLRPAKDGEAVVMETKTFKLLKTPDSEFEAEFERILSSGYEAVLKTHSMAAPEGVGFFAYSVSPKGAVYPFSEVEISCLMQKRYAGVRGSELCSDFFRELDLRIGKALARRQQQ